MPATPFIGQVIPVPYNFAPQGWAFCNGQILPIAQNTALVLAAGHSVRRERDDNLRPPEPPGVRGDRRGRGGGLEPLRPGPDRRHGVSHADCESAGRTYSWRARLRAGRRQQFARRDRLGQTAERPTLRHVNAAGCDVRGGNLARRRQSTP